MQCLCQRWTERGRVVMELDSVDSAALSAVDADAAYISNSPSAASLGSTRPAAQSRRENAAPAFATVLPGERTRSIHHTYRRPLPCSDSCCCRVRARTSRPCVRCSDSRTVRRLHERVVWRAARARRRSGSACTASLQGVREGSRHCCLPLVMRSRVSELAALGVASWQRQPSAQHATAWRTLRLVWQHTMNGWTGRAERAAQKCNTATEQAKPASELS